MKVTSPDFENNKLMPKKVAWKNENISPALIIENIPPAAKSLALIVDDPDAPMGTWVHWVMYDIPVASRIEEGSAPGTQGVNDFHTQKYDGPWPPSGTHRYFFKVYALDDKLGLKAGADKRAVEKAMEGRILDKAELVGLYRR
ncbi:MAG: YbhB/YbcL family Raf kinase inhibitor-like protein [Candidatus Omnitrophica bacterium]|nr:YbhB/YbcL family Raf kinase inhibitor-like protein [Candidatus Omnitrophota bacterium]